MVLQTTNFCSWKNVLIFQLSGVGFMAHQHCTGPGTGTGMGQGPGTGCTVHIAAQGMVQAIVKTYYPVQDPVVKWVWNPPIPCPCPCVV